MISCIAFIVNGVSYIYFIFINPSNRDFSSALLLCSFLQQYFLFRFRELLEK
jgi:hypothetical protein